MPTIQDWNDFLYKVGEDFYDFVHSDSGESSTEFTKIQYDNVINYKGAILIQHGSSTGYDYPVIGDFKVVYGQGIIFESELFCQNSNRSTSQALSPNYADVYSSDVSITAPNSYLSTNQNYWIGSDNYIYMKNASNVYNRDVFKISVDSKLIDSDGDTRTYFNETYGNRIKLISDHTSVIRNYNGYDYYFTEPISKLIYSDTVAPTIIDDYPIIINSHWYNSNSTTLYNIKNTYINNGDTITNYTYNIDSNNYITVNYSTDGDGTPTGYVDINPTGNISFDDLFDMFNTILAPLVGVGLDLPDWTTYQPPVVTGVTGDINVDVNIDLPDVTGVYPAETITPLDSDVYDIMPLDSFPQLPSLTGIDNGETAAALGSSFTFMDGCGLLMPFAIVAIIRLLISKFRGDS